MHGKTINFEKNEEIFNFYTFLKFRIVESKQIVLIYICLLPFNRTGWINENSRISLMRNVKGKNK